MSQQQKLQHVQHLQQEMQQFVSVSTILAGFAFTAVIGLLGVNKENNLIAATLIAFLVSAAMLLSATVLDVIQILELMQMARPNQVKEEDWPRWLKRIDDLWPISMITFALGALAFFVGVGLAGWIYSVPVGIASMVSSLVGTGLILHALTVISRPLPPAK
jgi:hypothetical protein